MDAVQDWAVYLMGNHETLSTYGPYARQLYSIISTAKSYLYLLIDQVSKKPDLATIALLVIIVFISLKILDILWQTVVFWVRLAARIVFWGALVAFAVWMYSRGPEGVMEDLGYWFEVWNQEHAYWREREKVVRLARQGGMGNRGTAGGWF